MIQKFLISFFLLTAVFIFSSTAQAGYNGDTLNLKVEEEEKEILKLFPRNFYTIDFFNNPSSSESDFTMRLGAYGEITGCAHMTKSDVEMSQVHDYIKLKVTDAEIELNDEKPRYTNYDCESSVNKSYIDIKLNRDDLIKNKIKKIKLSSEEYGEFLTSEITVTKEKIELTPNSSFMVTFWFFPKNSVILHTPHAKLDSDVQGLIRDFGVSQGLIPMEDALEKFKLPYNVHNSVFFTNPSGHIIRNLHAISENVEIGTITTTRTIYDKNGAKEEPYSLKVQATLPGQ